MFLYRSLKISNIVCPVGNNKEPRKRGRRPKTTKGNELGGEDQQPRQKKERRDDSASGGNSGPGGSGGRGDPFRRPPISQLKKTGDSWLQDGACFEVAPKLAKCRECRWTPHQRSKNLPQNIFCRFYAFRRLRYTKNGQLAIAGFSDPHKDASEVSIYNIAFQYVATRKRMTISFSCYR